MNSAGRTNARTYVSTHPPKMSPPADSLPAYVQAVQCFQVGMRTRTARGKLSKDRGTHVRAYVRTLKQRAVTYVRNRHSVGIHQAQMGSTIQTRIEPTLRERPRADRHFKGG